MTAEPLRGLHVAVTGASGFLGGRLAAALAASGARVSGFGRRAHHDLPGCAYAAWDIEAGPLASAPDGVDAVVHCAGMVTDWGKRAAFFRCHVEGTRHVLASFPTCPIVHVSTASVYDPFTPKRGIREDAPPTARYLNAYAESKAATETVVRTRERHIILRPHAIYGPGDHVLLPRLLEALIFGWLIAVGDGDNPISLTHVDNLVDAILLALGASVANAACGTFNIADATPVRLDAALSAVLKANGHAPRIVYLPKRLAWGLGGALETLYRACGASRAPRLTRYRVAQVADEYKLDCSKAASILGYAPTRDLFGYLAAAYDERRTSSIS